MLRPVYRPGGNNHRSICFMLHPAFAAFVEVSADESSLTRGQVALGKEREKPPHLVTSVHVDIYREIGTTVQGQPPEEGTPVLPLVATVYGPGTPPTTDRTA